MNFKIGDLIVGTDDIEYKLTNQNAICKIIKIERNGSLVLKIVAVLKGEHEHYDGAIEDIYNDINPRVFELFNPNEHRNFSWCD